MSELQHELGKRRPFERAEEEAYLSLVRTSGIVSGPFGALFRGHGLSPSAYNVLRILRGSGEKGRPASSIGADMVVRVPDVTRLVDRLEGDGLVERRRCPDDRRVVHVLLTAKGRVLVDRLDGAVAALHHEMLGHLSRDELDTLIGLLARVRGPHIDR